MNSIKIDKILPNVFKGMEDTSRIRNSRIWDKSFIFQRNCRICIQAESGGGKSSLLSFIYGQRNDYQGNIYFDNLNIKALSIKDWCDIRRTKISLLPQEMRLFPEISVFENIQIKNGLTNFKSSEEIKEMVKILGLDNKLNEPVGKLSIGQQQRVAIIRSLCQPYDFIFLDEPVSHLDEVNNKIAARLIEEEASKRGAGIITTSVGNHLLLENPEFINL